jgi:hypothetical protein
MHFTFPITICVPQFYIVIKVEMCSSVIHICVRVWENKRNEKRMLRLSLELVEVGGYYFSHPPSVQSLVFKRPLVDIEFDMPVVHDVNTFLFSFLFCDVRRSRKCAGYLRKIILFLNYLLATEGIINRLLFQISGLNENSLYCVYG